VSLVVLYEGDDVAVATAGLVAGTSIPARGMSELTLRTDVPAGHKVALRDLQSGKLVRKYGQVIGRTLTDVRAGEHVHVHVHNLGMPQDAAARTLDGMASATAARLPTDLRRTFQGFRRPDGRVATRNYVGVLTTINCSATVARKVARITEDEADGVEGVDGDVALTHGTGCVMAARGEGWELLRRTLAGYARNPNIGGLVVVGARANSPEVAAALMERIRWWEEYTSRQSTTLDANPSPGNKEGGITTILEKSLGAVAKAGHSPLTAVRQYAEEIPRPGLVFMDTPGYDPVSVTGMIAGGANLVCFTTGRGSVFGSRPVPTVKLGSNAEMARRMAGDIDLLLAHCRTWTVGRTDGPPGLRLAARCRVRPAQRQRGDGPRRRGDRAVAVGAVL
jgi:altronate dehydratase